MIALTSIKNCLILVTEDKNLKKVTEEFNGQAITLEQFQKRELGSLKILKLEEFQNIGKLLKLVMFFRWNMERDYLKKREYRECILSLALME